MPTSDSPADLEVIPVAGEGPAGGRRSVPWFELAQVAALIAIAVLVFAIAGAERRLARADEFYECIGHASDYRPDFDPERGVPSDEETVAEGRAIKAACR